MPLGLVQVNELQSECVPIGNHQRANSIQFGRKNRIAAVETPMYFGFMKPSTQIRPEDRAANFGEPRRLPERRFWQAVLARDRRYDGAFVYAVRSTGIYCRPSCPSRRPRRQQVAFFPVPEAAELAGFGACRRCRPGAAAPDPRVPLVRTVCQMIDAHPDAPADLATLSART